MSQHPAGRYNSAAPFRRGPAAPLSFSSLTTAKRAIVFMAEFDVDRITTGSGERLAPQIGVFHGLYRLSRQVTELERQHRRYATRPLLTSASDSPAMAEIYGQLQPVRLERTLDVSEGGRFGAVANSAVGVLTVQNSDGSLDDLDDEVAIVGRDVRISAAALTRSETGVDTVLGTSQLFDVLGTDTGDVLVTGLGEEIAVDSAASTSVLSGFGPIFSGVVETLEWSRSELRVKVRDARLRLERPVQRNTFSGSGGFEGTLEMKDLTRPLAFGRCTGVSPALVDPILLIYQYHDGELLEVTEVYDGGLPLDHHSTVSSLAQLEALVAPGVDGEEGDFPLGSYVSCPLAGCFRLAGIAERSVTADVRGSGSGRGTITAAEPFSDGTFFTDGTGWASGGLVLHANRTAGILQRILITYAQLTEREVAVEQLQQIGNELPYEGGLYLAAGESRSALDVAAELAASLGCILIRGKDGRYQLRRLAPPSDSPVAIISQDMIIAGSLERQALPYRIPWTDWEVSYARNWTLLSDSEMFPGVIGTRRFVLSREAQVVRVANALVASIYNERAPAKIDTVLVDQSDALEVGNRHVALYTHGRTMIQLRASGIAYRLELMDTVRLVAPRYGLDLGRNMLVVDIGEDGDSVETRLRLFG